MISLIKDIIGKKYNHLRVISFAGRNKWGHAFFVCECDCGKVKVGRGSFIKSGELTNCGCLRAEKPKLTEEEKKIKQREWANAYYAKNRIAIRKERRIYERKYYRKNRKKLLAKSKGYNKIYYEKHLEKVNARNRAYYHKHKDKINRRLRINYHINKCKYGKKTNCRKITCRKNRINKGRKKAIR